MPGQGVAANLHLVGDGELDQSIALREVELVRSRMNGFPLHHVFGFEHVELARERGRIGRLAGVAAAARPCPTRMPECVAAVRPKSLRERRRRRASAAKSCHASHFESHDMACHELDIWKRTETECFLESGFSFTCH